MINQHSQIQWPVPISNIATLCVRNTIQLINYLLVIISFHSPLPKFLVTTICVRKRGEQKRVRARVRDQQTREEFYWVVLQTRKWTQRGWMTCPAENGRAGIRTRGSLPLKPLPFPLHCVTHQAKSQFKTPHIVLLWRTVWVKSYHSCLC